MNTLYVLDSHSVICQIYLKKLGKKQPKSDKAHSEPNGGLNYGLVLLHSKPCINSLG